MIQFQYPIKHCSLNSFRALSSDKTLFARIRPAIQSTATKYSSAVTNCGIFLRINIAMSQLGLLVPRGLVHITPDNGPVLIVKRIGAAQKLLHIAETVVVVVFIGIVAQRIQPMGHFP